MKNNKVMKLSIIKCIVLALLIQMLVFSFSCNNPGTQEGGVFTKLAAVVYGGYIHTSTDSGATWVERTVAGSRFWISIASSDDGTKLAAVVNGGYIYTSTDSGVTWVEQTDAGLKEWLSIASSDK